MTYNVFSGTLSLLNQSITFAISYPDEFLVYTYFVAVKLNLTVSANNVNYHEITSVPNYYLLISSETKHCEWCDGTRNEWDLIRKQFLSFSSRLYAVYYRDTKINDADAQIDI